MDWIVSVLLCAVLVVVDQLIKAWATAVLAPVGTMPLLPGIIQLRYVLNDGAAFSMLAGKQVFNFADVCVCTGVGLLVLSLILEEVHARGRAEHEDESHGDT